ncbi:hypothetical protein [Nocardia salmonicida]|uniref:hypothetical protein n=1 Tax=Nocardia salmonicida TaxID=53431 RepID=UPI0007A53053|nr:hypothetical protein [Nocardia salmonicida]MBC7299482.1 hypothetical protein [Nocardia sp.]
MSETAIDPIADARQHYQDIWDQSRGLWDLRPWFEHLMAPETAMEWLGSDTVPISELFLWPPILTALDREELPLDDIALFARINPTPELTALFIEVRDGQWKYRPAELVARFTELTITEPMKALLEQCLRFSPEFQAAAANARKLYEAEQRP